MLAVSWCGRLLAVICGAVLVATGCTATSPKVQPGSPSALVAQATQVVVEPVETTILEAPPPPPPPPPPRPPAADEVLESTPLLPERVLAADEVVVSLPVDVAGSGTGSSVRLRSVRMGDGTPFVEVDLQQVIPPAGSAFWIIEFDGKTVSKTSVGPREQGVIGVRDRRTSPEATVEVTVSATADDGQVLVSTGPILLVDRADLATGGDAR